EFNTYYIRSAFTLAKETLAGISEGAITLSLSVSYDDAFVIYINGTEVGRDNVGDPGEPVAFDATADESRNETVSIDLPDVAGLLVEGSNVLAVQGVNATRGSRDFFIGADLMMVEDFRDEEDDAARNPYVGGVINELKAGEGDDPGFIEIFNPEDEELDLGGSVLLSSRGNFIYEIPVPTVLQPGGFVVFDREVLAIPVPEGGARYILLAVDGRTILDDIDVEIEIPGRSVGRFPEGDEDVYVLDRPTAAAGNVYTYRTPVVINEIHFHPTYVPADENCERQCSDAQQWIELINRSEEAVDLTGWKLTNGVRFTFDPGTTLAAGGYLVVASSLEGFSTIHEGVENVVGDWSGRLNHSSDTVNLRDSLGNRVARVVYGDGGTSNDEDPEDDVDDRTFRGSAWP
ncbi:MAG: lamin tail domain-containing protein, partial [Planctomycetes bacterium]|nr:lamin tail domain-containing protein [Planctomycetota bacterium]